MITRALRHAAVPLVLAARDLPHLAGGASPATSRRSARLMCVSIVETEMFILSATCAGGNPSIRRK